jgi:hypothetical protein
MHDLSINKVRRVTFVEVTFTVAILAIITIIVIPFLNRTEQKGMMAAWKNTRSELLLDRSLITYYDFSEGRDIILKNNVVSLEGMDYDSMDYDARIVAGADWVKGRWKTKPAVAFNGETSHAFANVVLPSANTIIIWFKTAQLNSGLFSAKETRHFASASFRAIYLNNGNLSCSALDGTLSSTAFCADDKWHMAAVTLNGTKHMLYLDGKKVAESEGQIVKIEGQKKILLGYSNNAPFFKGLMDEFLLYKRVLSEEDIAKLYKSVNL